jgi:regulator of protease activity HflC (stomatin/prohibitin superfamily)
LAAYGITVEAVSITDFKFSDTFEAAIETKVTAVQNFEKEQNNLQRTKVIAQQGTGLHDQ